MYELAAKTFLEELGYVVVLRSEYLLEYLLACVVLFVCGVVMGIWVYKD